MPSAQLETPPQSFIPMPAPPDIQWSNLLCYSGNQALGTNTCDTVPRADGKPCERKRERTSGVHHRLTSAPLKYFDAGHGAVTANDHAHSFPESCRHLLLQRIAHIYGLRDLNTHTHYVSFHGVFSHLLIARTRLSIANNHLRNSGLRVEDTEAYYWVSHSLIHSPSPTRVGERQKAANDHLTSRSSTLVIRCCVFV